jgi:hypothetical protein
MNSLAYLSLGRSRRMALGLQPPTSEGTRVQVALSRRDHLGSDSFGRDPWILQRAEPEQRNHLIIRLFSLRSEEAIALPFNGTITISFSLEYKW